MLAEGRADLAGKLETIPVGELLQFLDQTRRKGLLTLASPAGEQAHVTLVDGGLLHARHGHLSDREAVIAMLGWRKGRFDFVADPALAVTAAPIGVLALVMETARLEDELERLAPSAPEPSAKLCVRERGSLPDDPLDAGTHAVFAAIAAQPGITPDDLTDLLPLAPIKVRLALAWLGSMGQLTRGAALSPRLSRPRAEASDWYGELLCNYPAGIRVLIAASPAASSQDLGAMVTRVGDELGAGAVSMSAASDGPSMVRIRPPAGGLLSLTFLPMRQKHRFLFQTFARATDFVLVCDSAPRDEVEEWESDAPLHIPHARIAGNGGPGSLFEALRTFARTRSERRQRRGSSSG